MRNTCDRQSSSRSTARAGGVHLAGVSLAVLLLASIPLLGERAALAQDEYTAETSAPASGWQDYDSNPLRVNLGQDHGEGQVCRPGEPVEFTVQTNRDAYAVVYRIDADGEVTILWPRGRFDDGFIFGQHEYQLPTPGAPRLLASDDAGQEYVEAVVSMYPFDLRDLEVDFQSESSDDAYHYRVTGDPFLAMNEVNYAITGLENSEDFVVTNYLTYDVGREVDHPRYLCSQCHADDPGMDPYADTCLLTMHHDYGWANRWYLRFGYYPVYAYPAYYYVDPWTWEPWVNYWYTPWYGWPDVDVYGWPYSCHVWSHSPFWHGDSWTRWRSGDRRYLPLDKRYLSDDSQRSRFLDRRSLLVKSPGPADDARQVLDRRFKDFQRDPQVIRSARGGPGGASASPVVYRDVRPERRSPVKFREQPRVIAERPGLRIPEGGRTLRSPSGDRGGAYDRPTRQPGGADGWRGSSDRRAREEGRTIRTVDPRRPGTRIWSGGRANPNPDREVRPGSAGRYRDRGARALPRVREPQAREPQVHERASRSGRGAEMRDAPVRSAPPAEVRDAPSRNSPRTEVRQAPAQSHRSEDRSGGQRSGGGRSGGGSKRR